VEGCGKARTKKKRTNGEKNVEQNSVLCKEGRLFCGEEFLFEARGQKRGGAKYLKTSWTRDFERENTENGNS